MGYSQGKTHEKNEFRLTSGAHRGAQRTAESHRHKEVTMEQCREHLAGFLRRLGGQG